jgi:LmbE family N-acetylglucosaminyl deacetylase
LKSGWAARLRHTAEGRSVGLCDLTAGELGSNGAEIRRSGRVPGTRRGLARKPRLADGGITETPKFIADAVNLIRRHRPRSSRFPWDDRHRITWRRACFDGRGVSARPAPL